MQRADDSNTIHELGHRVFVGGDLHFWEEISKLQFDFLISEGLKPADIFVDVACGSLRGGCRLIPYLDCGHFIGLEKHIELVIYGVAYELGIEAFRSKRPQFLINGNFEFGGVKAAPTFGIAQSLFSHLTGHDIAVCLGNLRPKVAAGCRFFATFFETESPVENPERSHSHQSFKFTQKEMEQFGSQSGWFARYIGVWGHPRGQRMIEFRA